MKSSYLNASRSLVVQIALYTYIFSTHHLQKSFNVTSLQTLSTYKSFQTLGHNFSSALQGGGYMNYQGQLAMPDLSLGLSTTHEEVALF